MRGNKRVALGQGVRMGAYALNIRKPRARHCGQAMRDFPDIRAVDAQAVFQEQVVNLADRAGGRVFDWNHAHIRSAVAHGAEHLLPRRHVDRLALWEQRARRQLLVCARYALVVDGFRVERGPRRMERETRRLLPKLLAVLIFAARADHALQ